jgi:hypothetical protein
VDNADSEQILGKLDDKEIYFTENRLIVIEPSFWQYAPMGFGLVSNVIRGVTFYSRKKKLEQINKENNDLALDEKLQKIKGSYATAYDNLDGITLSKSYSGGQLCIKGKNGWKYLGLNKEEFKQLSNLLPTIPLLKDKLTINY